MSVLKFLNEYANLLLVVVTLSYVVLTWLTLKALRKTSFREHESRHLDDMKRAVSEPILGWLDGELIEMLSGGSRNLIQVTSKRHRKPHAPVGEQAFEYRKTLDHAPLKLQCTSSGLYIHAKANHFKSQLSEFELFLSEVQRLGSDCVVFALECANKIGAQSPLPRIDDPGLERPFADVEAVVESVFRELLSGHGSNFYLTVLPTKDVHVTDSRRSSALARGPSEPTRQWLSSSSALMEEQWTSSTLRIRAKQLLERRKHIHSFIEEIAFTYALPGGCKYVWGRNDEWLKRIWARVARRESSHEH